MKKMRKLLVFVLVVSMILSLTACSKKAIDADKFEEIMEDEFDCDIEEYSDIDSIDESLVATNNDDQYFVEYSLYKEAKDADNIFDLDVEKYKDRKEDGSLDGTVKKSGSGSFEKLVVKGDIENDYDDSLEIYMVVIRSGKMIITATVYDNGKKAVKEIDSVIEELGY